MHVVINYYAITPPLSVVTTPTLSSCSLILESGSGTSLSTSCDTPTNETAGAGGSIFTNIVPYQLRGMWEGFYTGPTPLPPKPAYIPDDGYRVGVAVSEMSASILRAASKYVCMYTCMYVYVYVCICVCMYMCMYMCLYDVI